MRGQKPDLKVIEGGITSVPPAPRGLSPAAKAEWRKSAGQLIDLGILAESDLTSLEAYCISMAMVRQLQEEAAKAPAVITVKSGAVKRHPAHAALSEYLKVAKQYAAELGLTPASRNRKALRDLKPAGPDSWEGMDL